jgi:hypothetical protein
MSNRWIVLDEQEVRRLHTHLFGGVKKDVRV